MAKILPKAAPRGVPYVYHVLYMHMKQSVLQLMQGTQKGLPGGV